MKRSFTLPGLLFHLAELVPIGKRQPVMPLEVAEEPTKNPYVLDNPNSPTEATEAFRRIYRKLLCLHEEENLRTFAITSPHVGEGKTLLSINLALTASEGFSPWVTLVDCDFRNPRVHKYLGIRSDKGLAGVIQRKEPVEDVIVYGIADRHNLRLVPAGKFEKGISPELYQKGLTPIIEELKADSDLIILDTPPILPIADHEFLSDVVDAIFLVVRPEVTKRSLLKAALETMQSKRLRGIVVNGMARQTNGYYHYRY
jgi:capsular exopolysaccharide synthesis family protein